MGIKKSSKLFSNKKRRTYLRMLKSIIGAFIIIIIILIVLQLLGINVSSMLAGVGIASIIVGFALQDAMKDIFRGLEIVADDYYDIGDVIKFNDNFGQVLSINLRTTRIQDINTMNIVSIANRNIDKVEVSTGYIYLPVPFPLRIKPSAADEIMQEIVKSIQELPNVTSVINQGTSNITNSSLNYQLQITCDPMNQLQVRRDCLGVIADTFATHKILFPYNQIDVHGK
ncbi:mechanosensitive ion channel family protein [Candidatus Saccharibacteria bacterium]|nr:mechanosensitive ion channel family protein [Candidatus Saccharibacteria bacterium]